jgi:MurNAc alpha-1-phosphate uridylyltransferase
MRALIFAAGRGERMRPLSDATPKPLLRAGGRRLVEWQIAALARAGIRDLVINTAHLAPLIEQTLGDGSRLGVRIAYSREGGRAEDALETLGGIVRALELLAPPGTDEPFVAVSGDIVSDYDYGRLAEPARMIAQGRADAHLVLVPNPPWHAAGDMGLHEGRICRDGDAPRLTYANIGVFAPRLFRDEAPGKRALFPWLYGFASAGRVSGERFDGVWHNVGTPADLAALDAALSRSAA